MKHVTDVATIPLIKPVVVAEYAIDGHPNHVTLDDKRCCVVLKDEHTIPERPSSNPYDKVVVFEINEDSKNIHHKLSKYSMERLPNEQCNFGNHDLRSICVLHNRNLALCGTCEDEKSKDGVFFIDTQENRYWVLEDPKSTVATTNHKGDIFTGGTDNTEHENFVLSHYDPAGRLCSKIAYVNDHENGYPRTLCAIGQDILFAAIVDIQQIHVIDFSSDQPEILHAGMWPLDEKTLIDMQIQDVDVYGMAFHEETRRLYVSMDGFKEIYVYIVNIDLSMKLVERISTGQDTPAGICLNKDGTRLIVCFPMKKMIRVISLEKQ